MIAGGQAVSSFDAVAAASSEAVFRAAGLRHQRVDGKTHIAFRASPSGETALADLYQRAPCRFLFPMPAEGQPLEAVLLTTSGGLTGGDRITVSAEVGDGAAVTLTTQAAEKLYRSLSGDADTLIDVRLTVGSQARAEWLGQEAILFDQARVRRRFEAEVAASGRLLALESLVLGRIAMGERYGSGRIHDSWRIRRDGRLLWADALHLEGDVAEQMARPFGFGAAEASATLVYVGLDAESHLPAARALIADAADENTRMGATSFDGLLIVRLLGRDAALLRGALLRLAGDLRAEIFGGPARMPTVWTC